MTELRPVRLQLSRRKGFDLQAAARAANGLPAVKCDRSSGFGNPFPISKGTATTAGVVHDMWIVGTWTGPAIWFRDTEADARELAVKAFRQWLSLPAQEALRARALSALRGKNLACWCAPGTPCHADVLLELANRPTCEEAAP